MKVKIEDIIIGGTILGSMFLAMYAIHKGFEIDMDVKK